MNAESNHTARTDVLSIMAALSKDVRLGILEFLVQNDGRDIQSSGIAERLNLSKSNVSFHLMQLLDAKLIVQRKEGQFHYYAPDYGTLRSLIVFLFEKFGAPKTPGAVDGSERSLAALAVETQRAVDVSPSATATSAQRLASKTHAMVNQLQEKFVNDVLTFVETQGTESGILDEGSESRTKIAARLNRINATLSESAAVLESIAAKDPDACRRLADEIIQRRAEEAAKE